MNVALAILGLAALILFHEAGHFLSGLVVGMRPRSFNIGFGPPLAKITRRGIVYAVRAIPLGGYVKIPGMHRPAASDVEVHFGRAVSEAPELVGPVDRLRRRLEGDGDLTPARAELETLETALGEAQLSPVAAAAAQRGVQELGDSLNREAYWRSPTWKRIVVILAGPAMNVVVAIVLFAILFVLGGGKATSVVDQVLPNHPAAKAGLRAGDRIVEIDRKPVKAAEIPDRIQASKGLPITLTIDRHRDLRLLGPVRARKEAGAYRLGFRLRGEKLSAPAATWESVKLTGVLTREMVKSFAGLIHKKERKQLSSTVGIVQASSNAATKGVQDYIWVLGLISLALAVFNLLPLLPLDGGHIVFSLIERVRGRAVGRAIYERASAVGIALVLLLFIVGLSNDIGRLNGG